MNDLKGTTLSFIGTGVMAEAMTKSHLGQRGLRTVLSRAVWAAYQKSKYLGGLGEK